MSSATELDNLCVVLVGPRNPLNIGAAARAMSNLGFMHLRVVNPYAVAFREARSAVGAAEVMRRAEEYPTVADAIADCTLAVGTASLTNRALRQHMRTLPSAAKPLAKALYEGRVALLFGSEKTGLSNEDLSYCHWLIQIPTREAHSSMNLGQAVAVCLYELARREPSRSASGRVKMAAAGKVDLLTNVLLEGLRTSGYLNPATKEATGEKIRLLVRRLNWTAEDADLWLGMLRQMVWKMKNSAE